MKKVFYNNWIAKTFLFSAHTITFGPFVLSKRDSLEQRVINHECTHTRQWIEMTVLTGIIIWILMLIFNISAWWMLLAAFAFYIWYVVEYLILLIMYREHSKAYKNISFECEARKAEYDNNYLENSHYFAWLKYIKDKF